MSTHRLRELIAEAREIGISIVLIAGGEPQTRQEILEIASDTTEIIFTLFADRLLINDNVIETLKRCRNLVPAISLGDLRATTDPRCGAEVAAHLVRVVAKMKGADLFFGMSITPTRENFDTVADKSFVRGLLEMGARLVS